jgi:hypothetical protein
VSQENVEIVRRAFDSINRGDVDAALEAAADDFEMDWSNSIGPLNGVYRGRPEALRLWRSFLDAWDSPLGSSPRPPPATRAAKLLLEVVGFDPFPRPLRRGDRLFGQPGGAQGIGEGLAPGHRAVRQRGVTRPSLNGRWVHLRAQSSRSSLLR